LQAGTLAGFYGVRVTVPHETYGTVVVFEDLYGNRWDLIERKGAA
jgi:hypothetical protein